MPHISIVVNFVGKVKQSFVRKKYNFAVIHIKCQKKTNRSAKVFVKI